MTRATNFGRKRTYLQAGLQGDSVGLATSNTDTSSPIDHTAEGTTTTKVDTPMSDSEPPKKKRKRVRKKKQEPEGCKDAEEIPADGQSDRKTEAQEAKKENNLLTNKALKKIRWKEQEKEKKQRRGSSDLI
jgi:hypothetical protein